MTHPIKTIFIYITLLCISQSCPANNFFNFEPIAKRDYPALIFIEDEANTSPNLIFQGNLYVVTVTDGKVKCQKIITPHYVQATQISDSVFLAQANEYPFGEYEKWRQSIYLVNFASGSSVLLSESVSRDKLVHYFCIRSDLNSNKAVLLRYGQGTENPQLFEIDLKTLEQKLLYIIPKKDIILPFPNVKLSPDFNRLAAMVPSSNDFKTFTLRIIDLKTMKVSELDTKVALQISPVSSRGGTPPLEWISNNEILYQDMLPQKGDSLSFNKGTYILKCCNIDTKKTSEWIRQEMPLRTDGGSLKLNPFTGNIEYMYNQYIVDVKKHSLIPNKPAFSVIQNYDKKPSEVYYHGKMIYKDVCSFGCISHSSNNFAFFTRPDIKANLSVIQAVINGNEKPVQVKEVSNSTNLLCWIEDTNSLRKK